MAYLTKKDLMAKLEDLKARYHEVWEQRKEAIRTVKELGPEYKNYVKVRNLIVEMARHSEEIHFVKMNNFRWELVLAVNTNTEEIEKMEENMKAIKFWLNEKVEEKIIEIEEKDDEEDDEEIIETKTTLSNEIVNLSKSISDLIIEVKEEMGKYRHLTGEYKELATTLILKYEEPFKKIEDNNWELFSEKKASFYSATFRKPYLKDIARRLKRDITIVNNMKITLSNVNKDNFKKYANEYKYTYRLRGLGPGCQPNDFISFENIENERFEILTYNRKLTDREIEEYELRPI